MDLRNVKLLNYFWTNTIWYLLLGVTIIITLLYVLIKSKKRGKMFALFLAFAGFAYFIELQILSVFKGYDYYPKIFDNISQLNDSIIGNTFSQFSIAATALLLSFVNAKWFWYVLSALAYAGIEELFLSLGIYRQFWYSTWMTIIGFPLLLGALNAAYRRTFNSPGPLLKYLLTFFAAYAPFVHIFTWPFSLLGYPAFNYSVFTDLGIGTAFYTIVQFVILFNCIFWAKQKKLKWQYHLVIILILYLIYYSLYSMNYIVYKELWLAFLFATSTIGGMYVCILMVRKLFGFQDGKSKR